jgi:hypothetical protein
MRIVRGEPERGDDRGALVRRRVTQRDEVKNRTGRPPSGVRPGPRNAACEVPAAAATARRSASVAAGSSSVTAVGLPPRPSRRTHASTTVTSGQDIGPPLTLNEPATANGVRR